MRALTIFVLEQINDGGYVRWNVPCLSINRGWLAERVERGTELTWSSPNPKKSPPIEAI